jgi:hypothetical protein
MGDIFIQKSSATISTFTNELGNGLTVEQFRNSIENVDFNDAESLKRAAGSCTQKCEGVTIVVSTKMVIKDDNCTDGVGNCDRLSTIELDNISLRL